MRRICTVLSACAVVLAGCASRSGSASRDGTLRVPASVDGTAVARGVVFHDVNGNERLDAGERRLAGVRVSNGRDIVETDGRGEYALAVDDDDIVFVIKPRGWRTPLSDTNLPRFYYIHKPNGSPPGYRYPGVDPTGPLPASIDFPLYPQREPDAFRAILFGDPQPRDQKEIDYIGNDVVKDLVGADAAFGVTLGDILFDDLSLFGSQAETIALIGLPWYNVIGNHDINYDAPNDALSDETFERHFGPAYYSFDYGPTHFIVLDDVEWYIPDGGDGTYRGGLGPDQIEFVRRDLEAVPDDQLVVLLMHIPLTDVQDRQPLYRLIEDRPFCISISGHTHHHEHRFITASDGWRGPEPHHHIINVTVCGSWWRGAPDERGIPHATMADGAPNGYSIISFDGTDYVLDYSVASRPADYKMQVHSPGTVGRAQVAETAVFVNFFNGSERAELRMRVGGGEWAVMERVVQNDPVYEAMYEAEQSLGEVPWIKLPRPKASTHLWRAPLPAGLPTGTHGIEVHAVDMWGREFTAEAVVRIEGD